MNCKIISFGSGYYLYAFNIYCYTPENHENYESHKLLKTIFKRYSEFVSLYKLLQLSYPGLVLPKLPKNDLKAKTESGSHEIAIERCITFTLALNLLFLNKTIQESTTMSDFIMKVRLSVKDR